MTTSSTTAEAYFPNLSQLQQERFAALHDLYDLWNSQINVISRKDMDNFFVRHVLHSLAIARCVSFPSGSKILDIGTGGGFPGIPLAILFPECEFTLVDSIGKKIKVVKEVQSALALENVTGIHARAESVPDTFNFIVSRAVTSFERFLPWTAGKFAKSEHANTPNGIYYLKGGDLEEELKHVKTPYRVFDIADFFDDGFFETKKVVFVQA